jgi:hypothetical protein
LKWSSPLIEQLWSAIEVLPDPEPLSDARRLSKQDDAIAMLRARGATIDEVASATGWQRHLVRGISSGTLKKKLGLTIASAKEDRGPRLPHRRTGKRMRLRWTP